MFFYHAQGIPCPHHEGTTKGRFSHDDRRVPYDHYKLSEEQGNTVFAITDVESVQLEMTCGYNGQQDTDCRKCAKRNPTSGNKGQRFEGGHGNGSRWTSQAPWPQLSSVQQPSKCG